MYYASGTQQFSTGSSFNTSHKCKYNLITANGALIGYTINVTSISNANITVYVEEFAGYYTHRNMLNSTGAVNVTIGTLDDVFLLVLPLDDSAHATFNVSVIHRPCTVW